MINIPKSNMEIFFGGGWVPTKTLNWIEQNENVNVTINWKIENFDNFSNKF